MAGLPPFNGFLSKEMFFTAMVRVTEMDIFNLETWGVLFPVIAWVASIFTFVYSMILVFKTFTGKYQPKNWRKNHMKPYRDVNFTYYFSFTCHYFWSFS